ncbi:MAG: extracellular solute-binding protein, partial [Propionibacteriaceae bacterium]|nr:extracellular solute-binding protein [Propionibacteriaceae bacterium]
MKISQKGYSFAGMLLVAAISLAGCGTQNSGQTAVDIVYSARLTGVADQTDAAIVESFNEEFDGLYHVRRIATDDETYKTKQITQLTGSEMPDVFYSWAGGRAKDIIDVGLAAPLGDYYELYDWDSERALSSCVESLGGGFGEVDADGGGWFGGLGWLVEAFG